MFFILCLLCFNISCTSAAELAAGWPAIASYYESKNSNTKLNYSEPAVLSKEGNPQNTAASFVENTIDSIMRVTQFLRFLRFAVPFPFFPVVFQNNDPRL